MLLLCVVEVVDVDVQSVAAAETSTHIINISYSTIPVTSHGGRDQ